MEHSINLKPSWLAYSKDLLSIDMPGFSRGPKIGKNPKNKKLKNRDLIIIPPEIPFII
jgi:hypothetical protein